MPRLLIVEEGGEREVSLPAEEGGRVLIGRAAECGLVLDTAGVSRRHCEIVRTRLGWTIHDLGSANGTWVNGARVLEAALEGDGEIFVGPVRLRFEGLGAAEAEAEGLETQVWRGDETIVAAPAAVIGLRVASPGGRPSARVFGRGTVEIGSDAECDIVLDGPAVLGRHASIYWVPAAEHWALEARAPVSLDGSPHLGRAWIGHGTRIGIHPHSIGVVLEPTEIAALSAETERAAAPAARPVVAGAPIRVRVLLGDRLVSTAVLDHLPITIGRAETSEVVLADPLVSRAHARIEEEGDRVVLRDLGSRNGTYVAGDRVEKREVVGGESIRIGRFVLAVEGAAGEGATGAVEAEEVSIPEVPRLPSDHPSRLCLRAARARSVFSVAASVALHVAVLTGLAVAPPPKAKAQEWETPVRARIVFEDDAAVEVARAPSSEAVEAEPVSDAPGEPGIATVGGTGRRTDRPAAPREAEPTVLPEEEVLPEVTEPAPAPAPVEERTEPEPPTPVRAEAPPGRREERRPVEAAPPTPPARAENAEPPPPAPTVTQEVVEVVPPIAQVPEPPARVEVPRKPTIEDYSWNPDRRPVPLLPNLPRAEPAPTPPPRRTEPARVTPAPPPKPPSAPVEPKPEGGKPTRRAVVPRVPARVVPTPAPLVSTPSPPVSRTPPVEDRPPSRPEAAPPPRPTPAPEATRTAPLPEAAPAEPARATPPAPATPAAPPLPVANVPSPPPVRAAPPVAPPPPRAPERAVEVVPAPAPPPTRAPAPSMPAPRPAPAPREVAPPARVARAAPPTRPTEAEVPEEAAPPAPPPVAAPPVPVSRAAPPARPVPTVEPPRALTVASAPPVLPRSHREVLDFVTSKKSRLDEIARRFEFEERSRVTVRIRILPSGRVERVERVRETVPLPDALWQEIEREMMRWEFRPLPASVGAETHEFFLHVGSRR